MGKYLLGVDVGTQGSKGIIVDFVGNIVASAYREHEVSHPQPGWAEHDANEVWWGGLVGVLGDLFAQSNVDSRDILAVGCSAISPCMLPLDKNNKPLRPAILYGIDTRTGREINELNEIIGTQNIIDKGRVQLSTQSIGPKILWYKRNEPQLFSRTARYATATTWLTYCLTGSFVMDYSNAFGFAPMFDAVGNCWDEEICKIIGIESNQLPMLFPSNHIAGKISQSAAKATGLKEGTPVIVGTGDFVAELLSTGAEEGDTILIYGSTLLVFRLISKPDYYPGQMLFAYPIRDMYITGGATATAATITKWFRDQFGFEEMLREKESSINAYKLLNDLAAEIPAGSDGLVFLPYFSGERTPIWDEDAKGVLFGLNLYHTKAHIYRAVLEGIAYSLKHNIEVMKQAGLQIDMLLSAGGGVKSRTWVQIMSDVTGVPQRCFPQILGSPGGCAYLAGQAMGVFKDMSTIREEWIEEAWTVEPNMKNTALYDKYYEVYREIYENTKQQMSKISQILK